MPVLICGFRAVLTVLVVALPLSAIAQTIEIKGLRVGMPKAEVQEKFPSWKDFTIAGVRSKYEHTPVHILYRDDKLDYFLFFFNASSFATVLGAVKEKYPKTVCETSQVGNLMGATFEQTRCSLKDTESVLQLSRYVGDVRTSSLSLMSKRWLEEQAEKAKQREKDL